MLQQGQGLQHQLPPSQHYHRSRKGSWLTRNCMLVVSVGIAVMRRHKF
jgi:hypothetical protein